MKKRSRYNPHKQMQRLGGHLVKDILLVNVPRNSGYVLYHMKKKAVIQPDRVLMSALARPYKWSTLVAGLALDNQGRRYIKTDGFFAQQRYMARDLNPLAEETMVALLKTMNPSQMVGEAWIASPMGHNVTEEEAMFIFEGLLAWDIPQVEPELVELLRRTA